MGERDWERERVKSEKNWTIYLFFEIINGEWEDLGLGCESEKERETR